MGMAAAITATKCQSMTEPRQYESKVPVAMAGIVIALSTPLYCGWAISATYIWKSQQKSIKSVT